MTANNTITEGKRLGYTRPESQVILINVSGVLCLSPGTESMGVKDYGDGGFQQV